ncbi:unnamed protein product, partial [Hapterophycus canaliculatus]
KRERVPPAPPPPPPGGYRILILVGIPGSGKSTFSSFLEDFGWTVVNQDTLGSREKCRVKAQQVLRKGGRVVVDRCNFNQSQRVTWIDLAVSLSLHQDACIAVWLDIPVDICRDRVQRRVGHPTLGAGRMAEGIVKKIAGDLRPPNRKEGFHTVLRCKSEQDLSEAVDVLSCTATAGSNRGGIGRDHRPVPPNDHGAPIAPRAGPLATSSCVEGPWGCGGGHGRGDAGEAGSVLTPWGSSHTGFTPTPTPEHGGMLGRDEALPVLGGDIFPGRIAENSGAPPVDGPFGLVPTDGGIATDTRLLGAGAGQFYLVGAARNSRTTAGVPMLAEGAQGAGPVLAWGGEQPHAGGGCDDAFVDFTGAGVNNNGGATTMQNPESYPSLSGGRHPGSRNTNRRFTGSITKQQLPRAKTSPQAGGYVSSSLSTIAKLTPQAQSATASTGLSRQAQPTLGTRQLTAAEISASFSDLQAPPRTLAPQDVGVVAAPARTSLLRRNATGTAKKNMKDRQTSQPPVPPLGPSNLEEWTSPLQGTATAAVGSVHSEHHSGSESIGRETAESWGSTDGCGVDAEPGGKEPEEEGLLDLSDGEAFFVLEDMFGGLLPQDTLEKVFVESRNNLQKALKEGFQICEDLWGRGEEMVSLVSPLSDTTTTDALLAPSTTTSTDSGSTGNSNDLWDESQGEHADVSEWTHEQV